MGSRLVDNRFRSFRVKISALFLVERNGAPLATCRTIHGRATSSLSMDSPTGCQDLYDPVLNG